MRRTHESINSQVQIIGHSWQSPSRLLCQEHANASVPSPRPTSCFIETHIIMATHDRLLAHLEGPYPQFSFARVGGELADDYDQLMRTHAMRAPSLMPLAAACRLGWETQTKHQGHTQSGHARTRCLLPTNPGRCVSIARTYAPLIVTMRVNETGLLIAGAAMQLQHTFAKAAPAVEPQQLIPMLAAGIRMDECCPVRTHGNMLWVRRDFDWPTPNHPECIARPMAGTTHALHPSFDNNYMIVRAPIRGTDQKVWCAYLHGLQLSSNACRTWDHSCGRIRCFAKHTALVLASWLIVW